MTDKALADPLSLARLFHDTYERLAPQFGYETREDTKQFDPNTPNGRLMTAVCASILAALSPPASETGDAVERVSAVDAFEMGYAWANQLQGQTLEDSRAVGRTLGSSAFAAIAPQINAAEKELGFDPFTSADYGICAARKIINAAIAATPADETALLSKDDAEVALWRAIENITLGNKTDDKLILAELRKLGVWLVRACSQCGGSPIREVLDGEALCQSCCDKWARSEGDAALNKGGA